MEGVVEWVKNYSMVFLLMTVLCSMTAKKEYRQYIQFFVEMILVIALVSPLLSLLGKSDDFFEKIAYDSFWQGLDSIRMDQEKVEFLNGEHYVEYYENTMEKDISTMAEDAGYVVTDVEVQMNEKYELESVSLEVAKQEENRIIVGTVDFLPEDEEITQLKEKIASYYQMNPSMISIED